MGAGDMVPSREDLILKVNSGGQEAKMKQLKF